MKAYQIETTSGPILVADFEDAQAVTVERDQLRAQVNALRGFLFDLKNRYPLSDWIRAQADKALDETPAQSLVEHDAALLEAYATGYVSGYDPGSKFTREDVAKELRREAIRVRKEANK